jgi:hypothetical protein
MKNKKLIAIGILLIALLKIAYDSGRNVGIGIGVVGTLDTVNKIMKKQIDSDTSVTMLVLVNPDTNVYFLSRRTVLENAQ